MEFFPSSNSLRVIMHTETQASWDVFSWEQMRFQVSDREVRAAYQEAAAKVLELVRIFLPEDETGLEDRDIEILFTARGIKIGTWRDGKMYLAGE